MRDWPPWKWLGLLTLRAPPATGQTSGGPAQPIEPPVCLRSPASAPRLWTTLRPGVAGAGHAGPVHRHSSRAIRAHRDIRRAQPVDKAVDHTWGARGVDDQ